MNTLELALICSSSPGFFRSIGSALSQHFRLLECFTLQESAQLLQLHRPELAILDVRGGHSKHIARAWAIVETTTRTRFVVVTTPGQLCDEELPLEISRRATIAELATHERGLSDLVRQILTPAAAAEDRPDPVPLTARETLTVSIDEATGTVSATAEAVTRLPAPGSEQCAAEPRRTSFAAPAETSSIADRYRTRTPELRQMLRRLEVAARHNVTILLIGETGSGKTHLASLIHDISPRAHEPFLHVACGALPGELIESELFGHVKGAFTSAHADKDGKFLVAGNGTILLDEIDVLTPDQQVKLLRVIEKGEFEPVGSNRTLHVKARIIAASNLQLQPLVEQGRFRPDLYYRLNTLCFTIPPLRKRLPDIEPLARYFVHHHAAQMGIDVVEITQEFLDCLLNYPWPGNVREMENAIRSAVIYSDRGRMTPETLPLHIIEGTAGPANDPSVAAFFAVRQGESLGNRIELTEKDIIEQALLNNNFSRTNTARHLGISRVTLYNKMRKYGILPER